MVAVLVIANSFSVLVAQRIRELGLLRLIGASRSQLMRIVFGEAAAVAAVGAIAGAGLGSVLAYMASRIVRLGDVEVHLTMTPMMALVAVVVALTTSMVGCALPAWRAGRVSPLEAMSDTRAGADRRGRGLSGFVLAAAGLGVAAWTAQRGGAFDTQRMALIGAGVLVGFAGLALLSRWVVVPFTRVVGWPLVRLAGVSARLGVGNTRRQPSRTAGAASTLMVALALVAMVSTFGASARKSIDAKVTATGGADLLLERRGVVRVSTPAVADALQQSRRGVVVAAEITAVDGALLAPNGARTTAVASDLAAVSRLVDLGIDSGSLSSADPASSVAVAVATAQELGVSVGDHLSLQSLSGTSRSLMVVAIYTNTAILGPAVVPWITAREIGADGTFELATLDVRPGAPVDHVQQHLQRIMSAFPKVAVGTPERFAERSRSVTDTTLRVIYVLLIGSLGLGVLGLASTLALSTLERRRELVMLRAIGASRFQIRSLVWMEATMIGLIAAVLGITTGATVGRLGVNLAPGTLGGSPVIAWKELALVGAVSVVTAWVVSLGVARRAARVPPAEAGRM